MIISVGSDHAGYNLKKAMIPYMESLGHTVIDHGNNGSDDLVYFPDMARKVCGPLVRGEAQRGVMFCGTGVGASIACNKIPGIRASTAPTSAWSMTMPMSCASGRRLPGNGWRRIC